MNIEHASAGQGMVVDLGSEAEEPPQRAIGFVAVILVHLLVGYALVSGLARDAIEVVKKPLLATIVQEVKIPEPPPPPPPPPKKIKTAEPPPQAPPPPFIPIPEVAPAPSQAPAITAVATPPVEAPVIAPPHPEAPAPPQKMDIGVACPTQVKPEMPQRALIDGIGGVVRAQVRIHGGRVSEVAILAGPKVFHDSVRRAMLQYRCAVTGGADVVAVQEIKFEVE